MRKKRLSLGYFDMVFSVLRMLGMSGWEVASTIEKLDPEVISTIVTGRGIQFDRDELKKNRVGLIVNKPFRAHQILRVTREAIKIKDEVKRERN